VCIFYQNPFVGPVGHDLEFALVEQVGLGSLSPAWVGPIPVSGGRFWAQLPRQEGVVYCGCPCCGLRAHSRALPAPQLN
jgi:hypothetical protein